MIELLLTARDPATALAFQSLIKELSSSKVINLHILLQAPASDILEIPEVASSYVSMNDESSKHYLVQLHSQYALDAVLVGVSGPDMGVDEVALLFACQENITSYALQGFWGDFNRCIDVVPDHVFTLDKLASTLNTKRFPSINNIEIGSIKHKDYQAIDSQTLRLNSRKSLSLSDELLIGFYGQPLHTVNGYFATIVKFAEQLSTWQRPFKLMYRPHPKETSLFKAKTIELFKAHFEQDFLIDNFFDINQSIAACDLVTSAFSTCCIDAVYMNRHANQALNASIFLWYDNELIDWWQTYSEMEEMPMSGKHGLIYSVAEPNKVIPTLEKALVEKDKIREKATITLPDASEANHKIITTIQQYQMESSLHE